MTPTPKLRFVERADGFEQHDVKVTDRHGVEVCYRPKKIRILQQWWEDNSTDIHWVNGNPGEWRDVPLEVEA
jgi:hypothetical protein